MGVLGILAFLSVCCCATKPVSALSVFPARTTHRHHQGWREGLAHPLSTYGQVKQQTLLSIGCDSRHGLRISLYFPYLLSGFPKRLQIPDSPRVRAELFQKGPGWKGHLTDAHSLSRQSNSQSLWTNVTRGRRGSSSLLFQHGRLGKRPHRTRVLALPLK